VALIEGISRAGSPGTDARNSKGASPAGTAADYG
jgi:hypothetical protein